MKYLSLIWFGIWRKRGRTVLIFLQVSVAFALFGLLQGLKSGVEHAVSAARADLLLVHGRSTSFASPLPLAMVEQIRSIAGVKVAIPVDIFVAAFQKPTQRLAVVALTPDPNWTTAFTYSIAPNYLAAFSKNRTGALARVELAAKYGWKVGDHIPLMSSTAQTSGATDWTFDLVGTYTDSDIGSGSDVILVNLAYVDEARLAGKGTAQHINVAISEPRLAVRVAEDIDKRFANSSNETQTDSLRELAQMNLQAIGDLNFLIRAIVATVLVAMLFATSTMMMQTLRERTPELAVLKTIGFSDRAVFLLILAESTFICVTAAALGLALAALAFPYAAKVIQGLAMPASVVEIGLACAVLVGLVSAAAPAIRAARLEIIVALRGR